MLMQKDDRGRQGRGLFKKFSMWERGQCQQAESRGTCREQARATQLPCVLASKAAAQAAGTTHLLEQQPQRALRIARVLSEAVGALARKQRDGPRRAAAALARERAHERRLARARRAVQQDAPADEISDI